MWINYCLLAYLIPAYCIPPLIKLILKLGRTSVSAQLSKEGDIKLPILGASIRMVPIVNTLFLLIFIIVAAYIAVLLLYRSLKSRLLP